MLIFAIILIVIMLALFAIHSILKYQFTEETDLYGGSWIDEMLHI